MYLVTGAAGLIGGAIVRALNQRGIDKIICVDHLGNSPSKWKNLREIKFLDYFEKEDFLKLIEEHPEFFKENKFKAIIHMGACSSTTESNVSYLIKNNFEYSKILTRVAIQNRIRMIYASSAATYGNGDQGFDDNLENLEKLKPLNPYGFSKHLFDLWLKKKGYLNDLVGLKYFNVFGPYEFHKGDMRSMVLKGFEQIMKEGKIKLFKSYHPEYEDGKQKRDFLYVKDAAEMTLFFLENEESGIFNIGSGLASTWLELAESLFEALGKQPNIEFIEMPAKIQKAYQYYTCAPIQKIRNAGYHKNITPLKDAILDYVQNYLLKDSLTS